MTVDEAYQLVIDTLRSDWPEDHEAYLAAVAALDVVHDSVPALMGATEAAAALEVTTSNLGKVDGLEPVQRLTRGALYRAADVQRIAEERRARRAGASE